METRKCKVCNAAFTISFGQAEYLNRHGLSLPLRCPACRAKRSSERQGGTQGAQGTRSAWQQSSGSFPAIPGPGSIFVRSL